MTPTKRMADEVLLKTYMKQSRIDEDFDQVVDMELNDDKDEGKSACLNNLPEELTTQICDYLNKNSLVALCLTNRRHARIVAGALYKEIKCEFAIPEWRSFHHDTYEGVCAESIFDTLFWEPSLSVNLRRLEISIEGPQPEVRRQLRRLLKDASKLRTLKIEDTLDNYCTCGKCDVPIDTSYIQTKMLGWNEVLQPNIAQVEKALGTVVFLDRLTSLEVTTPFLAVEDISQVFRLPSLNGLFLTYLHQERVNDWTIPEASSSIRELSICGRVSTEAVAMMVRSVKRLEHLYYQFDSLYAPPLQSQTLSHLNAREVVQDYTDLGNELRRHEEHLLALFLPSTRQNWERYRRQGDAPEFDFRFEQLGSLRGFKKLQSLRIDIGALVDLRGVSNGTAVETDLSTLLPSSLQHLNFCTEDDHVDISSYTPVIASLQHVMLPGTDKMLLFRMNPWPRSVELLQLLADPGQNTVFHALKILEQSGLEVGLIGIGRGDVSPTDLFAKLGPKESEQDSAQPES